MDLGKIDGVYVTEELGGFRFLFIPDVADPLEEEQRQNVGFPIRAVDGAAPQNLGTVPEMRLEVLKGQRHLRCDLASSNSVLVIQAHPATPMSAILAGQRGANLPRRVGNRPHI